jgi:hypothetical protein
VSNPGTSKVGAVVVLAAGYEVVAVTVNKALDEDILPSITGWLQRPWLPGAIRRVEHATRAGLMWGAVLTVAVGVLAARHRATQRAGARAHR